MHQKMGISSHFPRSVGAPSLGGGGVRFSDPSASMACNKASSLEAGETDPATLEVDYLEEKMRLEYLNLTCLQFEL